MQTALLQLKKERKKSVGWNLSNLRHHQTPEIITSTTHTILV